MKTNLRAQSDMNYQSLSLWAAHPEKTDFADGVPVPSLENRQITAQVDVFFVHPTTYTGKMVDKSWNAPINDIKINEKTDNGTIKHQASIFNGVARVYAPRYRQAHLNSFYPRKAKGNEVSAFKLAYSDVKKAFLLYMEKWNLGRPFIIASHSQGTRHAEQLIKELIDGSDLQESMVVAYLIGMPVTKDAFLSIPICNSPEDNSCFVSWRTYKFGHLPKRNWGTGNNIAVVNPISWTTDTSITNPNEHKGIVLRKYNAVYPYKSKAQIANNVLWITKPTFPGSFLITTKNYHGADYNLFWMDIRDNVRTRVNSYLGKS
ncbi:MAG: DUF3089 domain-containing protein [Bacteroidia bacterium]|nr:DUF3089 domain-containing protein [Bacteroidia bacterium]